MKRQPWFLAGTAIGLLMASAPLGAYPLQGGSGFEHPRAAFGTPLILAQADCEPGTEGCEPAPEQRHREKTQRQEEAEPAPAAEEAPAEPKPRKQRRQEQVEQAPAQEMAPAEQEQQPRRKKHQQEQAEPDPAGESAPAAEPEQKPRKQRQKLEQQPEQAPAEETQKPRKHKNGQEAAPTETKKEAPAQDQQMKSEPAQGEQPVPAEKPADSREKKHAKPAPDNDNREKPAEGEKPSGAEGKAPAEGEKPAQGEKSREGEKPAETGKPAEKPATGEESGQGKTPAQGERPATGEEQGKMPAEGKEPATGEKPASGEKPEAGKKPEAGEKPAEGGKQPAQGEEATNPDEAPLLDSQKDAERRHKEGGEPGKHQGQGQQGDRRQGDRQPDAGQPGGQETGGGAAVPAEQGPPPTDDKAAQQEIRPEKIAPVTEERGKRRDRAPYQDIRERPRPKGVDVLKEIGDRLIIQLGGQTLVESSDRPRMTHGARDVYYEDLPGGRTRETIERDNGTQIVTIRNRYGDIVRRSRITPDGREYVLSYVDESRYEDRDDWRDPGDDLPPLVLDVPRRDYILDSESVEDPDDYYTFLEQPPVERVQRLYSINEVKRSARVRDIARRIDLDTLNFDFGSYTISESEVQKLQGVADAMQKLLKKNPAETFLIEGHTDAVGSAQANLALSDRRAESVAQALTNVFDIPPENLTTQGYGEEYLKVNTSGPERENRRVAIRRITPLVAPVASAN